jgi:hypothetical protein
VIIHQYDSPLSANSGPSNNHRTELFYDSFWHLVATQLCLHVTVDTKKPAFIFFEELKRRNVFNVGDAYVITDWLLQV